MTTPSLERELLVQVSDEGYDIALLENGQLVEFYKEYTHAKLTVGDMFWGRVKKILPTLNAVFVDIGHSKEAFLHYTDLGESFHSSHAFFKEFKHVNKSLTVPNFELKDPLEKVGEIQNTLKPNDYVLTQIIKEPMSTKGARLSSDISLPGRYIVLIPFDNNINISKKISDREERARLMKIVRKIKPKNFGVIVRTVAEGKPLQDLHQDMLDLLAYWNTMCQKIQKANHIEKVFEEEGKTTTVLRDILNDSFKRIVVNSKEFSEYLKQYVSKIAPDKLDIIKVEPENKDLFEKYDLNKKLKSSFNKIVLLPSGGYLIFEKTEAMHVIDVNSGLNIAKKANVDKEEILLKTNVEALKEIARQIRLRDLGGIISIDFIDTKIPENREIIYKEMLQAMSYDKAEHTILPLSKFCVMQLTRSRNKQQIEMMTTENCLSCRGTGKIFSSILIGDMIYNKMINALSNSNKLDLTVHPFVYAYLKEGFPTRLWKWKRTLKASISLSKNSNFAINEIIINRHKDFIN
jgi:ribonuclease G